MGKSDGLKWSGNSAEKRLDPSHKVPIVAVTPAGQQCDFACCHSLSVQRYRMSERQPENDERKVEIWHLEDVEAVALQHPDTFKLPTLEERQNLDVGRRVRLHFDFDQPISNGCRAERMWVTITKKTGSQFTGTLDNQPVYIKSLSAGSLVSFNTSNIAQILILKTDPRWINVSKKAIVSKRVFELRRVSFLYRETPRNVDDSGWVVWGGGEDDEFTQNSRNFDLVSLERLLAIDESIGSILNAAAGSAFERAPGAKEFRQIPDWKPGD
jgi:hypothetical protein